MQSALLEKSLVTFEVQNQQINSPVSYTMIYDGDYYWVRLFIFAQNTFHLCWSKKNFLSLLLTKRLLALATDFSAFAHFF
jgi:hypothetical protein